MKKTSIAGAAAALLASLMLAAPAVAAPEKDTKYIDMQCGTELLTLTIAGAFRAWDQDGNGYLLQSITQTTEGYGTAERVLGGGKFAESATVQCTSTVPFELQGFTITNLQLNMVPLAS